MRMVQTTFGTSWVNDQKPSTDHSFYDVLLRLLSALLYVKDNLDHFKTRDNEHHYIVRNKEDVNSR